VQYAGGIPQHLIIPEAEHAVACRLDDPAAGGVPIRRMVATVDLDDQPRFRAIEVRDVPSDRVLTAELDAAETPVAEEHPHSALGILLRLAQLPRVRS